MTELESEAQVEVRGLPHFVSDELVTLYFENRRRSGGGPLRGWQRLDGGGILTFQKPEDAQRVLAQASHVLQGTAVSVMPSPPRAPQRLLLLGLRPDTAPELLELYVESLLSTKGECQALASPRPDRVLVQLPMTLSEAEFEELASRSSGKTLDGTTVSLAWVPQARAIRVVGRDQPPDPTLLQLYLENERRSGGGALEGLRTLPRAQGTVVTFQQWEVAERVLNHYHQLCGSELNIVPHYDVLDPEPEPEPKPEEGERPALGEMISIETPGEKVLRETFGKIVPVERLETAMAMKKPGVTVPVESAIGTIPLGKMEATGTRETPEESVTVERPGAVEPLRSTVLEETVPMERSREPVGHTVPKKVVPREGREEMVKAVVPMEILLPMEPGALRFLQLYYQEFLTSLDEVTLSTLDGPDVTGFQLSGALELCQAAEEFLQSLLGSIECHTLPLKHPGSACFLLGSEGQGLLKDLEVQFHCILTVDQQVVAALDAALDADPVELDPMDLPELPAAWAHDPSPSSSTVPDTSASQMEEIKRFLDTLKGPDEEECPPLETEDEELHESEEGVAALGRTKETLEEEAALQLALHHSLEEKSLTMWETRTLKQALMLSLLDDIEPNGSGGGDSRGRLLVHVALGQDLRELSQALEAVLRAQLREERVTGVDQCLPPAFWSRLERHHDVTIILQGNCAILSGYGPQPSSAANHLRALMTVPLSQSHILAPDPARAEVVPQVMEQQPLELECLEESSEEFQETVRAFCSTLGNSCNKIRIIKVQRVSHPLLQSQYELHKKTLEESCPQHPVERILYHGTSWQAVPDICSHGFNRSFCGRNATLYGQGVYFAVQAKVSIQDRYSPPDAKGHKAVFVARVLTGDYGRGHPELRVPPQRDTERGIQRYDSVVDSTRKPRIFVIFHDTQALPIFLITCQCIEDPSMLHSDSCSELSNPSPSLLPY
ncbi:protein mono-ADP-ribosyltransferase PARP10 [Trichosurus vulpecula]|uniref:protein mono-ADP-ribosyltransferase PARP10 n=1 Tax=Trichosurus vulpecula TaxID=9337 RepID=UPI00186AEBD6|nr:protein mono-ADP-ribosyltransferase PARP10 [Trichosurus vulpecula]